MAYFPMFVDITDEKCLVVGGGKVAARKITVLLDYGARVYVVAPDICDAIVQMEEEDSRIHTVKRSFVESDLENAALTIVATNDYDFNRRLSAMCKEKRIPVNVVDCKEECSFILPSYIKEDNLVAAFSSAGNSPVLTQYLKQKEAEILTPYLGEVNEYLGQWRPRIIDIFDTEAKRKEVFLGMLELAVEKSQIPTEEETLELIEKYRRVN